MTQNILEYYKYVHQVYDVKQPFIPKQPEELMIGRTLKPDIKHVTIAQFDRDTKNYITAHKLADYRRNTFSIRLLPRVHVMFDDILEGSAFWYDKLHSKG